MTDTPSPDLLLPLLDWLALAACLVGAALGALAGLPRAFTLLLWSLAALWLGNHLSARVVDWMPNSFDPADPAGRDAVQVPAFAIIAGLVLSLPLAARLLAGASGKKKAATRGQQRAFGGLVGLVVAVLLVTLFLPFLHTLPFVGEGWARAAAPRAAAGVADNAAWLFPPAHRGVLRDGP
jgi:uncharacterized membrane protein required for colicin V production